MSAKYATLRSLKVESEKKRLKNEKMKNDHELCVSGMCNRQRSSVNLSAVWNDLKKLSDGSSN